jgi:hypothetical protein
VVRHVELLTEGVQVQPMRRAERRGGHEERQRFSGERPGLPAHAGHDVVHRAAEEVAVQHARQGLLGQRAEERALLQAGAGVPDLS